MTIPLERQTHCTYTVHTDYLVSNAQRSGRWMLLRFFADTVELLGVLTMHTDFDSHSLGLWLHSDPSLASDIRPWKQPFHQHSHVPFWWYPCASNMDTLLIRDHANDGSSRPCLNDLNVSFFWMCRQGGLNFIDIPIAMILKLLTTGVI